MTFNNPFLACFTCFILSAAGIRAANIPLTLGTTYSGTLALPGETHTYTFAGTPGQRLFLDAQDADSLPISVALQSPTGITIYQLNDDFDFGPFALTESGKYSLTLNGNLSTTGSYRFRLLDLAIAAPLTLGATLSDQLSPALACNLYQFSGTRGQRINLQSLSYSSTRGQWQLVSPANVVLALGQIYQSLGSLTLPITGPYCLMVSGADTGISPLTFQVSVTDISDTPVAASGFGVAHSGTVNANQTNSFTYTAPAGLPVYFDSLDKSGQSLYVDLIDPFGNAVFSAYEPTDAGPYVLPYSGTYTVIVFGPGGGSGNFNFRLLDLSASPTLPLNTAVSNVLSAPYQTDVYQFTGTPGQRLFYESMQASGANVQVRLLGPDGQTPLNANSSSDAGPVTLAFGGTYYLFQQSGLNTGPNYSFQLLDAAAQPTLPLNLDFTGSLPPNAVLMYQLAGTNGERLYFNGKVPSAPAAFWTLYDPRDNYVGGASLAGDFALTLSYDETYLLVLTTGYYPITFSNQVNTVSVSTNALVLGTTVTNDIVHPGDQVVYTFSGTAGQKLYYDSLNANYLPIYVSLVSPTGVQVFSGNAYSDLGPTTLPQSGIYTLTFSGSGHTTGPISFQLLDVGSQPALPLNADFTGIIPSNTSLVYQLAGTSGEQLYFNGKGGIVGNVYWTLFDPENLQIASANIGGDFQLPLPYHGNYTLVLSAYNVPTAFSNQVNIFSFTTNTLTLGAVVTNNITHPGDQVVYAFNGTAGQRVYWDSLTANYLSLNVTLFSPTGVQLSYGSTSSDFGPLTLLQSGTYTLVLNGSGHTTGPISFRLLDVAAQPVLPLNTDLNGTLQANATLLYQLSSTSGGQFYFNAKGASANGSYWTFYDPQNTSLGSSALAIDFQPTLTVGGTYVLALQGGLNSVNYTNQVNPISIATNALTLGNEVTGTIVNPGDQLYYTFTGTAGQRLYYDSRETNGFYANAMLVSPTGQTVFNVPSLYDQGPFTLTRSGTYSLIFTPSGDTTGTVAFNLLDLSAAAVVTATSTIADSLGDQTETKFYRFGGTTGQRVNLQSLSSSGSQANWTVFNLVDQNLGFAAQVNANIGTLTLPATGSYVVAVIGTGSAGKPLSYQLQLSDVTDSSVAPTGFGTVQSGTVAGGQTNTFTYSAPAGLPIFFDSQDTSGQSLVVDMVAPDGSSVFYSISETSDGGPYTLPRSGTYTVSVRGYNGTASGNYSFRLLDLSASPHLAFNTVVTNALNNPYETDAYQFSTIAGQALIYDAVTNDVNFPSVYVQLVDPRSQNVGPSGDFSTDRGPFAVQYAGTCYLFCQNRTAVTSSYAFQMLDVSSQPVLPINTIVTNTMTAYPDIVYRYSGTAGQRLYFQGNPSNPGGSWYLYDPNNAYVPQGANGLSGDLEVTLPLDGTYALVLSSYSGATPGPEVFTVNDFAYTTNAYTIGTSVADAISRPGERRVYTFTGTLGQRLFYDALTNDPPAPNLITAQLLNPQGVAEGPIAGRFSVERSPFTLQQSGTYTLVFDGNSSSVGSFAFRLLDVAAQPLLPLNIGVTNTLDLYPAIVYRYSGAAGQRLYFQGQQSNLNGTWSLYDPNNTSPGSAGLKGDFKVTLPMDGTYTLLFTSYDTSPGGEVFQVNDFNYFTNSYTIGTPVVDSINRPGEQRIYTFTGTLGQQIIYDALTNDPPVPNVINVQLLNPQGVVEGPVGGRFSYDHGPFALQQSGSYSLVFNGNSSSVGALAFRLLDVAAQPVLPINVSVTNTLNVYPLIVYQYTGTAGQMFYFRGRPSNPSGAWILYDPNSIPVPSASGGLTTDFQLTVPFNGTYTLVLNSYAASPGAEIFMVNPFNFGETTFVNRAPILSHIPDQITGEGSLLSFTAQATDPDTNALTFSLDPGGPGGAVIDPASGVFTWTPQPTGFSLITNVTVRVTDNGIPNLSAAQTLNLSVVSGPIMITIAKAPGSATVFWRSAPGKHYHAQYKNTVKDGIWTDLGGIIAATDFVTSILDNTVGTNNQRYYHVQLLDPTLPH